MLVANTANTTNRTSPARASLMNTLPSAISSPTLSSNTRLRLSFLGSNQTILGKVQGAVSAVTQSTKNVDRKRGSARRAGMYVLPYLCFVHMLINRAVLRQDFAFGCSQKVRTLYTITSKQVLDTHNEACRITKRRKLHSSSHSTMSATGLNAAGGRQRLQ